MPGIAIRDGFEARGLSDIWNSTSAPDNRVSFRTGEAREGRQSLALEIRSGDIDESCKCQRTEIREATHLQPEFGSDVWYRFSLKITNLSASLQTTRWMLGAWKQEVEGSPFLGYCGSTAEFFTSLLKVQIRESCLLLH